MEPGAGQGRGGRGGGKRGKKGGGRGEGGGDFKVGVWGNVKQEGWGDGRGEVKPGGWGDGRGEVKPGGRGDGRGEVKPGGRGDGRGEVKPGGRGEGRGEVKPGGRGEGRGEVKPGGRGEGREVKPGGRGEGRGEVKAEGRGEEKECPSSGGDLSAMKISQEGQSLLHLVPLRKKKEGKKSGVGMVVETNNFPIEMKKWNINAYQYDVVIEPNVPKYMIRLAWNEFVKRNFPENYPSFDGKSIAVSAKPLVEKSSLMDTFQVANPENGKLKEYKVEIKLTNTLNLENLYNFMKSRDVSVSAPLAELAALDIVLRNHAANTLVRAGRSMFQKPKGNILSLGEGMEVWYGYYQSAVLGWKLFLNFDVSHKGFPKCDILETVEDVCLTDFRGNRNRVTRDTVLERRDIQKLEKHLKSLKVEYEIPGSQGSKRVYKVNGVRSDPASQERFRLENKEETNVVKYYRDVKQYNVKFPNLPCLWVGSTNNRIYVPMELCTVVPGQVRVGKLSGIQTSNMIRYAADPPDGRKAKIMGQYKNANLANRYTNEFGISVGGELEKVEARVLDPPRLESGKEMHVQRGKWELNRFLDAKPLTMWTVLILDDRSRDFEKNLVIGIMRQAQEMGMRVENPITHKIDCDPFRRPQSVHNAFQELKRLKVALAFVIIPDRGEIYSKVKRISEIDVGVLTQCIRASTLRKTFSGRSNQSTLSNILLKVNAKLNGVNHSLHNASRPSCLESVTMIVGADVTHPPPDAISAPSIAAVAASHDTRANQYNTIRRIQPSKQEIIQDFQEIMKTQLLYFYKKNRLKPERIIVFRDGVSEGQVDIVLRAELRAIQQACISLQAGDNKKDYQPQITFLIVQKRHHTRFFPTPGNKFCDDRNPNVPPGTCVDSTIVHPRDLDFYLVSHNSRLGTARPTKYKLIYDDSDMTEDELERLSYYLCHLVSRCSMSISYPAPTYYAHLAAFRARAHLAAWDAPRGGTRGQEPIRVQDYFTDEAPMFFV